MEACNTPYAGDAHSASLRDGYDVAAATSRRRLLRYAMTIRKKGLLHSLLTTHHSLLTIPPFRRRLPFCCYPAAGL
jgi:hypothetical protein